MPLTSDELVQITRMHNGVKTAAQVRLAIGAALKSLGNAYPVADQIPDAATRATSKTLLDQSRNYLTGWFKRIYLVGNEDYSTEWAKYRDEVRRAYVVIAGVEGAASYVPRTSNAEILQQAIKEGQGTISTVLDTVGQIAGGVAGAAGEGVGGALGGVFKGLGIKGTLHVAVIGAVVLLVVTKGTIIGKIRGLLP